MFMSKIRKICVSKIWELVHKIKTVVDRLLSVSKKGKKFSFPKYINKFFFIIKTKSSLSTSVFISSAISQISETKFYVFCTQTCRNWNQLFIWNSKFLQVSHALKLVDPRKIYYWKAILEEKRLISMKKIWNTEK